MTHALVNPQEALDENLHVVVPINVLPDGFEDAQQHAVYEQCIISGTVGSGKFCDRVIEEQRVVKAIPPGDDFP